MAWGAGAAAARLMVRAGCAGQALPDLSLDVPDAAKRLRMVADLLAFEQLASPAFESAVQIKARQAARGPRLDAGNVEEKAREVGGAPPLFCAASLCLGLSCA